MMPHPDTRLVTIDDIRAAASRIAGRVLRTPLLQADPDTAGGLSRAGQPLYFKPENLQPSGAFKLRGATNAVAVMDSVQREAGAITHSSGNHGLAVARAAALEGIATTVVTPTVTPAIKIDAMRSAGAEVVEVGVAERADEVERIRAQTGATFIPPFDHHVIIAGQGTVGLEITEDIVPATVFVPVGGGGLIGGVAAAVKAVSPHSKVIGVEPELAADAQASKRSGRRQEWSTSDTGRTLADGLRSPVLGELNFAHVQALVDDIVTVTEQEIRDAMRATMRATRTIVEPSGAVAVAGYLTQPDLCLPGPAVAVISGGNVAPELLAEVMLG